MVSFKCKDIGMDCPFETNAPNVHELDEKVAQHAREVHHIPSLDKDMWIKIHTKEH